MFRSSIFDKTLDNACSHLRLEPDWPSILVICDLIRQNDITPKYAIQAVKKKLLSPNPHTAFYSLLVLESVMKNCGSPIHDEIATKENCETFTQIIETTSHENVKSKILELIQTWAYAFRTMDKYQAVKDTVTILKTKGHTFPELKEADAMFTSDTAPSWHDGKCCHRCRVEFTFTQRKHHCRNCGQVFCGQCSAKCCTLPKFGIEKEVRVCDGCYAALQKPTTATLKRSEGPNDLPAEYLNSSLAQQSQTPARKSDEELKEEEELQLALALSQSEAEQKNRSASTYRPSFRKSGPDTSSVAPVLRDPSPVSITSFDDRSTDPELAKYLNRDYWEQRGSGTTNPTHGSIKGIEMPTNPTAPSPMTTPLPIVITSPLKNSSEDAEIETFCNNMKTQVEIFVNRMKSNSSRGRSISTDSSVQSLFLNLTAFHSRLLDYIKKADDRRMWFEQLQDKLTQIKDSRAALDVLRQEHQEKLRQQAEEQERQRQLQMAYKLELMRKKKQEYLQYQRQLALQRIQEQEREMKMHQDQQKVMYTMGVQSFGPGGSAFVPTTPPSNANLGIGSSAHILGGPIGIPPGMVPNTALPISGYNQIPNSGMQRYPVHQPQPIYSSVGGQGHQAVGIPLPGQYAGTLPGNVQHPQSNISPQINGSVGGVHLQQQQQQQQQHQQSQAQTHPHSHINHAPNVLNNVLNQPGLPQAIPQQLPTQQLPHHQQLMHQQPSLDQQQNHQLQQPNSMNVNQQNIEENKSNIVPEQSNESNARHVAEAELISFD